LEPLEVFLQDFVIFVSSKRGGGLLRIAVGIRVQVVRELERGSGESWPRRLKMFLPLNKPDERFQIMGELGAGSKCILICIWLIFRDERRVEKEKKNN
jgi:hypothetical protein